MKLVNLHYPGDYVWVWCEREGLVLNSGLEKTFYIGVNFWYRGGGLHTRGKRTEEVPLVLLGIREDGRPC